MGKYSAFFPVKTLTDNFSRESVSNFQREDGDDYWYRMVNWTQDGGWQKSRGIIVFKCIRTISRVTKHKRQPHNLLKPVVCSVLCGNMT